MADRVQLFLGLLTIIGSGVVSAVVTYRLNASHSEREFKRGKAEELYMAADNFYKFLFASYAVWLQAMLGNCDYSTAFSEEGKILSKMEGLGQRLEMLASLYFQSLVPEIKQLDALKSSLSQVRRDFERAREAKQNTQAYAPQLKKLLSDLEASRSRFKQRLIELNQKT
ncbi:MAG: hypothetical protein ABSG50_04880 [Opitutaceae bacterium]|jgi:hypothetical protein